VPAFDRAEIIAVSRPEHAAPDWATFAWIPEEATLQRGATTPDPSGTLDCEDGQRGGTTGVPSGTIGAAWALIDGADAAELIRLLDLAEPGVNPEPPKEDCSDESGQLADVVLIARATATGRWCTLPFQAAAIG
jgi:hypothetical protein